MDFNQRTLAARQFVMNKVKKSPIVQSVQQPLQTIRNTASKVKSLAPKLEELTPQDKEQIKKINFMNFMPAGRVTNYAKYLSPKLIREGTLTVENDMAQHKAMQHLDSAQRTADRIRKAFEDKKRQEMLRSWAGFLTRKF